MVAPYRRLALQPPMAGRGPLLPGGGKEEHAVAAHLATQQQEDNR